MSKKPTKSDLEAVIGITSGPEAQGRKRHNKQRPGEVYSATSTPEKSQLARELDKSAGREQSKTNRGAKGKPRAGEILTASEGKSPEDQEKERVRKFLYDARLRFDLAAEAESENRKDALDDLKFLTGEQWTPDIKNQRELDGRPCLTMNRLPQFVRQVTNEQRQQRPAIQVNPVGDGADTDTADVLQGMVRHIEVSSDAEIAYDTAFEHMVIGGFGWLRVYSKITNEKTGEQELCIGRIRNPFTVYSDPAATEPNGADCRYRFVIEDIPHSAYKDSYPDTNVASLNDYQSVGDTAPDWATKDTIRVAEYWYVEDATSKVYTLADGTETEELPEGQQPTAIQEITKKKVKCAKINAIEIIEERDWPGTIIPLVPVYGDDYEVDGKRKLSGMVRFAKDPQRAYNYNVSAATETVALAPKAPFIAVEGQIEGHESEWKQANTRNLAVLLYKGVDVGGKPAAAPSRNQFEPPIQAIMELVRQSDNDLKATTGIYDASLGERGPAEAGKAILARQKQSDVATLNYSDNNARSLRLVGRIVIEVIPHFYDTPRVQRIIDPDGTHNHVGIYNSQNPTMQGVDPKMLAQFQGVKKIYDIGTGKFDVAVSVGPSYQSKRQESVAAMLAFLQAYPAAGPAIADLIARYSDWNGSKEIAERLKKMLPPQLQDDDETDPEVKNQKLQTQLQQAMQQHDLLVKALTDAHNVITQKQIESSTTLKQHEMDNQTKVAVAEITTKAQDAQMRRQFEFDQWKILHDSAHDVGMAAMDQTHTLAQGDQAGQQAQVLAAQQAAQQPQQGAAQ